MRDAVILAIAIALPIITSNFFYYWLFVLSIILSIYTLSWCFTKRLVGWLSLGHSIPFGLCAYAVAVSYSFCSYMCGVSFIIIAVSVFSALLFYLLSILGKEKFVFSTFVFDIIFWVFVPFLTFEDKGYIVGGEEGFSVPSWSINKLYIASSIILVLFFILFMVIERSKIGYRMKAIKDDEIAASALGIDIGKVRFVNFLISSLFSAIGGLLFLLFFGHVSPEIFSVEYAIFPFVATVLFGDSISGAILGSFIMVFIKEAFSGFELHIVIYALLIILFPMLRRRQDGA